MALVALGRQNIITLSPRQYELMKLLCRGNTIKQAAANMAISYNTAYSHYDAAKNKLGTFTQIETVTKFAEMDNGNGVETPAMSLLNIIRYQADFNEFMDDFLVAWLNRRKTANEPSKKLLEKMGGDI